PDDIEGDFHLIVFADSAAHEDPLRTPSDVGFNRIGIVFEQASPLAPWDLVSAATRELARGAVKEHQGEGNNISVALLPVALTPPPDLQVTQVIAPTHGIVGQQIDVSYTVTNAGGPTVSGQEDWNDLIYLSRDRNLDLKADRYLGFIEHKGHLAAGQSYSVDTTVDLPLDLLGPYYGFVITDPPPDKPQGKVFEGTNERNNDRPSDVPLIIDLPPPSDLQVTSVVTPQSGTIGDPATITWTVTNIGTNPASGR